MLTLGPVISGFKMPGLAKLGPLEENEETTVEVVTNFLVPRNMIVAVGTCVEFM
jgi:predicted benzoate:H+ symporter BenE